MEFQYRPRWCSDSFDVQSLQSVQSEMCVAMSAYRLSYITLSATTSLKTAIRFCQFMTTYHHTNTLILLSQRFAVKRPEHFKKSISSWYLQSDRFSFWWTPIKVQGQYLLMHQIKVYNIIKISWFPSSSNILRMGANTFDISNADLKAFKRCMRFTWGKFCNFAQLDILSYPI